MRRFITPRESDEMVLLDKSVVINKKIEFERLQILMSEVAHRLFTCAVFLKLKVLLTSSTC